MRLRWDSDGQGRWAVKGVEFLGGGATSPAAVGPQLTVLTVG